MREHKKEVTVLGEPREELSIEDTEAIITQAAMQCIKSMDEIRKAGISIRTKSQEAEMLLTFQLYDKIIKISKIDEVIQAHREKKRTIDVNNTEQVVIGYFPEENTFKEKLEKLRSMQQQKQICTDPEPIQEIEIKIKKK